MEYDLLKSLLPLLAEFEQTSSTDKTDIATFSSWLNRRIAGVEEPDWHGKAQGLRAEEMITVLLRHTYRYGNFYIRKALFNTEFTSLDDFHYLMSLMFVRPMTVKELINRHIHEKPSGMEIVRRLLKKGMIEMVVNETDKRSKVIRITDKGRAASYGMMNRLKHVNDIVAGPLNESEKLQLISLLQKLDRFHNPLFNDHKNADFGKIYEVFKLK